MKLPQYSLLYRYIWHFSASLGTVGIGAEGAVAIGAEGTATIGAEGTV
jgi:hypothetical protein